ncbi:swr complex subunit [Sporothrix curviconia]|uniref:SWR1-complex protein 5 n=1 Tax=Sporothrix curviconia TaxID=1260050 RepID=A0ABP0BNQ5_9PEZI
MSAHDAVMDDENYASSEDSDFAPDNAPDAASAADSDSEGEANDREEAPKTQQAQRAAAKKGADEAEDVGYENSGDEAIIGKGKKRRRRHGDSDGEDGGVGGFVKTRHQRANEKAERRAAAVQGPVTVDVDALWSQMMGSGSGPSEAGAEAAKQTELSSLASAAMFAATAGDDGAGEKGDRATTDATAPASTAHTEMIKIKRTYNFAGQVHTEEKIVARDSAEAKLYLAEVGADKVEIVTLNADGTEVDGKDGGDGDDNNGDSQPKRLPPRKAFRSAFEPILDASLVQIGARTDLDLGLAARLQARERAALQRQQQAAHDQAKKLTTVEKSRMDWAGFVDREGIQDELAVAGKSKGAFVDRQQFLARTEMRREEETRRARMASKV